MAGLNLCTTGGGRHKPPQKKALENIYRVKMHGYDTIFQGQVIEKKDQTDNFNSLGAREGLKKGHKKGLKN